MAAERSCAERLDGDVIDAGVWRLLARSRVPAVTLGATPFALRLTTERELLVNDVCCGRWSNFAFRNQRIWASWSATTYGFEDCLSCAYPVTRRVIGSSCVGALTQTGEKTARR